MQFESIEDAHRYLSESIVRVPIDGEEVFGMIGRVEYRGTGDNRTPSFQFRKLGINPDTQGPYVYNWYSLDDIEISAQNIMLGNMNYNNRVYYCERMPVPRMQMGLTQSSLTMTNIAPEGIGNGRMTMYDAMDTDSMNNMLQNSYPTVAESLTARHATAFDRDFAVNPIALTARHLHYRGSIVGEFSGEQFTVYTPVSYVVDVLNRALEAKGEANYEVSVAV